MLMRFLTTLALAAAFSTPGFADEPAAKPADALETLLGKLFKQEVAFADGVNVNDLPLFELVDILTKKYAITFVINEECFKAEMVPDIKERKPNIAASQLRGLTIHQFLTMMLDSMNATYLVKGNRIEIVTPAYAAKVAKAAMTRSEEEGRTSLAEPLVSAIFKEKPLNEAVALLAERYDLNVIVSPQAGDAKTGFVTARLLNVPADRALELLALQNDLRIVRKGNAFFITSRDHSNDLFNEGLERERQKIELKKFRDAPLPKPEPKVEPKPEPKVEPKPDK